MSSNSEADAPLCSHSKGHPTIRLYRSYRASIEPLTTQICCHLYTYIDSDSRSTICRVYTAGSGSAVLFCLHGCGYTGLTWAAVAAAVKDRSAQFCSQAHTVMLPIRRPFCCSVCCKHFLTHALHCSRVSVQHMTVHITAGMVERR